MNKPTLFCLLTYNHIDFTKVMLDSFFKYTPMEENRIFVYDNASIDGTIELLKNYPIDKIINLTEETDNIPWVWNDSARQLNEGELLCILPNDVVFGQIDWLEKLQQDLYSFNNVVIASPYMNGDLSYDKAINEEWNNKYWQFYPKLKNDPDYNTLNLYLDNLYDGNFDLFCKDFAERNKNTPPLDTCLTHIMLFRPELFQKVGLFYDESLAPWGGHEFDYNCQLNNLGLFRICSSRSYVHHWGGITDRVRFEDFQGSEKKQKIYKNCIKPLQRWKCIPESIFFSNIPSAISNFRTKYYKFEKRNPELSFEEGRNVPGVKWMNFEGLVPGHNYFDQLREGSIIRADNISYKVIGRTEDTLTISNKNNDYLIIDKEWFNKYKFHIDYYWREEEEKYFGIGHMDFLLEK